MTVVERFIVKQRDGPENLGTEEDGEIAIGQRTYYRKRFLGKVILILLNH